MTPNSDQLLALLRNIVSVGGTIAVMLGVEQTVVNVYTTWALQIAGVIAIIIPVGIDFYNYSKARVVARASALPEVKRMKLSDPALAVAARKADPTTIVDVGQV